MTTDWLAGRLTGTTVEENSHENVLFVPTNTGANTALRCLGSRPGMPNTMGGGGGGPQITCQGQRISTNTPNPLWSRRAHVLTARYAAKGASNCFEFNFILNTITAKQPLTSVDIHSLRSVRLKSRINVYATQGIE